MNKLSIWNGPEGIKLPASISEPAKLVSYANKNMLTDKQQQQIISAFSIEAYDMAAEYAWRRAMIKLKETIATLGMKFVGEMLGRDDIDEFSSPHIVLTDYTTIALAEQLGIIGKTAALKLKQAQELLTHFFSKECDEELSQLDALGIVRSSVQYVLGENEVSVALEFSEFRERLLSESLNKNDRQIEQLINSPLFFIRTVLNILLSTIKTAKSATLEHTLANLNLILPLTWSKLAENDKWNVGTAYRDVVAEGNNIAANGIKKALLKVGGFDFVPENLRSNSFKRAARNIIDTHFAFDNFYNEPAAVKMLASMGSTIPAPALADCMQAYLLVYLGNSYGVSTRGSELAETELLKITPDRWQYYFEYIIAKDDIILSNFLNQRSDRQVYRFSKLLKKGHLDTFENLPENVQHLYNAILKEKSDKVKSYVRQLLSNL